MERYVLKMFYNLFFFIYIEFVLLMHPYFIY